MPMIWERFFFVMVVLLLFHPPILWSAQDKKPTQGQFAVNLVEKLGLGRNVDEEKAIEMLSSLSIYPGLPPETGKWEKGKEATEQFVAQIQASLQILLKQVAIDLDINPPPTLELFIFNLPPAPQRIYYPAETHSTTNPQEVPPDPRFDQPPPPLVMGEEGPFIADRTPPISKAMTPISGEAMGSSNSNVFVDQRIVDALSRNEAVPVIVMLKTPAYKIDQPEKIKQLVNSVQQKVLDTLSPDEFKVKHRYESIFSFSGLLLNKDGLNKLQNDANVIQIGVDELSSPQ